ncbi:MAG: ribonuclease P protein component [Xanthomonadales bacterium]|jgi:ribonuclease P protein component|nr:ribonuclease P protein component [Xanthomonadales bacterium]
MIAKALAADDGKKNGRATLPRSSKLLKPSEFKRVFVQNASSTDRCFRVLARPSIAGRMRLGMAVSKKVDKSAVGRNRIKRVIRESFRHWRAGQSPGTDLSLDIVVLARPASATMCKEQLFSSLEKHWPSLLRLAAKKFTGEGQPEEQERWET